MEALAETCTAAATDWLREGLLSLEEEEFTAAYDWESRESSRIERDEDKSSGVWT